MRWLWMHRILRLMLPQFLEFVGDAVLVAHNASFDVGFIEQNCRYQDIDTGFYICRYGSDGESRCCRHYQSIS